MGAAIRIMKNLDMDSDTLRNTQANRIVYHVDISHYDSTFDEDELPVCIISGENGELPSRSRRVITVRFDVTADDRQRRSQSLQSKSVILHKQPSITDSSEKTFILRGNGQPSHESLHGRSCSFIERSTRSNIHSLKPLPPKAHAWQTG